MASTLTLDRSDPGIDDLVSGWADGEEYQVTVTIRQDSSSENVANYTVVDLESDEEYAAPTKSVNKKANVTSPPISDEEAVVEEAP